MIEIVQKEDPILRKKAEEVNIKDIGSPKIKKIIKNMKEALDSQDDGVAIAAPQIGVPLRIFVISGKVPNLIKIQENPDVTHEEYKNVTKGNPDEVFINPKISKFSREKKMMEEGCLSVRWLYGKVKRSTKATIEALDENGNKVKKGASGLLAQIFQHETDHLNGKLFIDTAIEIEEIDPNKNDE